ncbi:MAG: serine/threonine protein phosphatase [Ruminococcaceae bacterium]|nr:serine/threonine protein phosphatase [Oscillospiraceae bacterium]
MALYAIGDLHLSLTVKKPMDIFGGAWVGYMDKLEEGISVIGPRDTTVLLGDLTWGMDFEQAKADFAWINKIPGRKIILKGNHDYWWTTATKFYRFCQDNGFENMYVLNNNCYFYNDYAICGTRGWFFEEERSGAHDEKVFRRELIRLETSLKAAGDKLKYCFLHYPPRYRGYTCDEILELFSRYGVRCCYYGHLHADSHKLAMEGLWDGVDFHLAAADYLNFRPLLVISEEEMQENSGQAGNYLLE